MRIRMATGAGASPSFGVNDERGAQNCMNRRQMSTVSTTATMRHRSVKMLLPLAASTALPKAGGER